MKSYPILFLEMFNGLVSKKIKFLVWLCFAFSFLVKANNISNPVMPNDIAMNRYSPEKIYVHLDKTDYTAEENIWFKIYLVNSANNVLGTPSEVVYIDLISPKSEVLETKLVKTTSGLGHGAISLPFDVQEGEFTLRAYTNYMRNFDHSFFFEQNIYVRAKYSPSSIIPKADAKPLSHLGLSIEFFPEGGQLVSGFNNKIGFRVFQINNEWVNIKGEIVDGTGEKVISLETTKFGRGVFHLVPKAGETYTANIKYNNSNLSFILPKITEKGTAIRIIESKDNYRAHIQSSLENGINEYQFIAEQRNGDVFRSQIKGTASNAIIEIPKYILSNGIVKFSLLDRSKEIVGSRLVFYEDRKSNPFVVNIKASTNNEQQKAHLYLEPAIGESYSKLPEANFSVSITKAAEYNFNIDIPGINTYLLLTSEIEGNIQSPNYYLESIEPDRRKNLDILMLTETWRDYVGLYDTKSKSDFEFDFETGIRLNGTVNSAYNQEIPAIAKVYLTYKNNEIIGFDETYSDANGKFEFRNLYFADNTSVMLQALSPNSNPKSNSGSSDYKIVIDTFLPPELTYMYTSNNPKISNNISSVKKYNRISDSLIQVDDNLIALDVVEVNAKIRETKNIYHSKRKILYKKVSQTMDFEDYSELGFQNPLDILRGRVAGLTIANDKVYLRAPSSLVEDNSALLLMDGIPVGPDALSLLLSSDIDFIDIIKGPKAAIYGSRAANGIIAVYTKTGNRDNNLDSPAKSSNIIFNYPGFLVVKEYDWFETSKVKSANNNGTDTLFWAPNKPLNNGDIQFNIKNKMERYKITIQGITMDGRPISSSMYFSKN